MTDMDNVENKIIAEDERPRWVGCITDAGQKLINRWLDGKTLSFVSAAGGTGVTDDADLPLQLALSDRRQELSIVGREDVDGGIRLRIRVTAAEDGYRLQQCGVWARLDDGEPTLMAIYQYEHGIDVPGLADTPDFVYDFLPIFYCANTDKCAVNVNASAFATVSDVQAVAGAITEQFIAGATVKREITIPTTGWNIGAEEGEDGVLYVDLEQADITEEMVPIISVYPGYVSKAKECGLSTVSRTLAGGIRLYAAKVPAEEIPAMLLLLKASNGLANGGGTTGSSYVLPAATATRLGGVKVGDGLSVTADGTLTVDNSSVAEEISATEEEASEMLAEVFEEQTE